MLDFLLPAPCLLCGMTGKPLCSKCLGSLELKLQVMHSDNLDIYYLTDYKPEIAKIITGIKDRGLTSLIPLITANSSWPEAIRNVCLVPIPSSKQNLKRRGFNHTEIFARKLAKQNEGIYVSSILVSASRRKDQAGLSPVERAKNMANAFQVLRLRPKQPKIVLVDDVYTTGATALEAKRTLEAAGFRVIACWVVALVQAPNQPFNRLF